jgi:hypothetical protein
MSEKPFNPADCIQIEHRRIVCAKHGEPFRAAWPRGWQIFSLQILQPLLTSDEFHADVMAIFKRDFPDAPQGADAEWKRSIETALDQIPACCRTGPKQLLQAYHDARIGHLRRCSLCGETRRGTRFKFTTPHGVQDVDHVCFNCVVYRLKETEDQ